MTVNNIQDIIMNNIDFLIIFTNGDMPRLQIYFPRPLGMRFRTKSNFSNCQPQCTKKTKKRELESLVSSLAL